MPFPVSTVQQFWQSFIAGSRLVDGGDCLNLAGLVTSNQATLTALAGGGAAGAPMASRRFNEVSVCATNGDSVVLPQAIPGVEKEVINNGAATLAVFAATTNPVTGVADAIVGSAVAGGAGASNVNVLTTVTSRFICYKPGVWKQTLSA